MTIFGLALLAVVHAESVYFWYFDTTCFEGNPWETEYQIGECFSTENNYGEYEYGLAQWLIQGETVQLSFHGDDDTCSSAPTGDGPWQYTIDTCTYENEVIALNSFTEVFYQWYETSTATCTESNTCWDQTTYIIGHCFYLLNDDYIWEYGKASWVNEGDSLELAFFGQDSTCQDSSISGGPWQYTLDVCVPYPEFNGAEMITSSEVDCVYGGAISVGLIIGIVLAVLLPVSCFVYCCCCSHRRRLHEAAPVAQQAPKQVAVIQPVYAQQQAQPVYGQPAYGQYVQQQQQYAPQQQQQYAPQQQQQYAPQQQQQYAQPPVYANNQAPPAYGY